MIRQWISGITFGTFGTFKVHRKYVNVGQYNHCI